MPKLIFLQDCEMLVCRNLDVYYLRVPRQYEKKKVQRGEIHSVEFLEGEHDPFQDRRLDVQFEDGTVAVGMPNYLFDIVAEH